MVRRINSEAMILANCEFCDSPVHIWLDCKKKPDGWKPDRLIKLMVPKTAEDARKVADDFVLFGSAVMIDGVHVPLDQVYIMAPEKPDTVSNHEVIGGGRRGGKTAATKEVIEKALDAGVIVVDAQGVRGGGTAKDITPKKRGRGRPKSIDDMKAYKALKARLRRAAAKAKGETK